MFIGHAGASDLAGSMSAAFAASSLVFRESDPAFAEELSTAAATLYTAVRLPTWLLTLPSDTTYNLTSPLKMSRRECQDNNTDC